MINFQLRPITTQPDAGRVKKNIKVDYLQDHPNV